MSNYKEELAAHSKKLKRNKSFLSINLRNISSAITRNRSSSVSSDEEDYYCDEPLLAEYKASNTDEYETFPTFPNTDNASSPAKEEAPPVAEKPPPLRRKRTLTNLFGLRKSEQSSDDNTPQDDNAITHDINPPGIGEPVLVASYFELCTGKLAPTKAFEAASYCLDNCLVVMNDLDKLPLDVRMSSETSDARKSIETLSTTIRSFCEVVGDSLTTTEQSDIPSELNDANTIATLERGLALIRKHKFMTPPDSLQLSTEPGKTTVLLLSDTCLEGCTDIADVVKNVLMNSDNIHCIANSDDSATLFKDTLEEDEPASSSSSDEGSCGSHSSLASILSDVKLKKSSKIVCQPLLLRRNSRSSGSDRTASDDGGSISPTSTSDSSITSSPVSENLQAAQLGHMTLHDIIEHICLTGSMDTSKFTQLVLLSFRYWSNPLEFCGLLREAYNGEMSFSSKIPKGELDRNLVAFIGEWTTRYWIFDSDGEAIPMLEELLTDMGDSCVAEKAVALVNYIRDVLVKNKKDPGQFSSANELAVDDQQLESSKFIDLNPSFPLFRGIFDTVKPIHFSHPDALSELAKQVTLLESQLFIDIDAQQFMKCRLVKGIETPQALLVANDHTYKILCWAEDAILRGKSLEKRTAAFTFFAQLALECMKLRNHATAHSLYVALENARDCSAITMMSPDLYAVFSYLGDIFSCFNLPRGKARKILMTSQHEPSVPVFSTYDVRIVKILEHKSTVDGKIGKTLINLPDYQNLADIVTEIKNCQRPYAFAKHSGIVSYLDYCFSHVMDENDRQKKRSHYERLAAQTPTKKKLVNALKNVYRRKNARSN